MTDKEIIKALECCYRKGGTPCRDCPFNEFEDCNDVLMADYVFNLINRQQAEIERLKEESSDKERAYTDEYCLRKEWKDKCRQLLIEKQTAKSEAIKEFAERLKSLVNQHHYMLANIHNSRDFGMFTVGFEQAIDNIVKEMVGDKE